MRRTKRKHVLFTQEEWEKVCKRAERLKMRTGTYIRNMSLHEFWKTENGDDLTAPLVTINHVMTDMRMILRVAEKSSKEHCGKINELINRFECCRERYVKHYEERSNKF